MAAKRPFGRIWLILTAGSVMLMISPAVKAQQFAILFTGNANGAIQNCYCPDARLGGLEKRAQFIATYREQDPDVLVLDNGDNFVEYLAPGHDKVIIAAMKLMEVDAINWGDQDIAYGTEEYFELQAVVPGPGRDVTIRKGAVVFSLLPILSPTATRFYPEFVFSDLDLEGYRTQIEGWLAMELPPNTVRILLSHSGFEEDQAVAEAYPGIDLIVGGHSQTALDSAVMVNGVPIVQAGGYAGYVGEIRFEAAGDKFIITKYELHPLTQEMPDHPGVMNLIDRFTESH